MNKLFIDVDTSFSDDLTTADVTFRIAEGHQVIVDHVLIVGNEQVDTETIRQELTIASGSPLGLDDVAEIRRRLNALGMFRRLDIREFSHGRSRTSRPHYRGRGSPRDYFGVRGGA